MSSGAHIYRIENIEIDPSQGCLRRAGREHHLRPKTFQLLLFLLERRPSLVTKDELIENLWKDTAVTDDAIVQCVIDIRRALGDDSRNPRFVKTVPKVGYRFIGSVEELQAAAPAVVEIERFTTVQMEFEEEIDVRPKALSPLRRRVVLAASVALLLAACLYLLPRLRDQSRPRVEVTLPQLPGKKPVAVMYFDNQSADRGLDWLREGLADMFITNLSRSPQLTVLSRHQLHALRERIGIRKAGDTRLEETLEIAQKSRAEVVVIGGYASLGENIRINVSLLDARTGRLLAAESLTVDRPEQIFSLVDLLSMKLAAHLGGTVQGAGLRGLADVMTNNLEAYRYYSLAMEKTHVYRSTEAIALLEKAVALDPEFAMAHAGIGYVYAVSLGFGSEAKPHLEKAFQLSTRLSEKDRLYITSWYAIANLDYSGAVKILKRVVANYPMEIEAYLRLGRLLAGEEQFEEAIRVFRQGLVVDPEASDLYNSLGALYSQLGRHEEGIAAEQRCVALAPDDANAHDSLGLSYQWAGRYREAMEEYRRALELHPDFEIGMVHLGNLYSQLGRYSQAIREYEAYARKATFNLERARGYNNAAWVSLKKRDFERAAAAVRQQMKYGLATPSAAMLLALAKGDFGTAQRFQEQLSQLWPYSNRGARLSLRFDYYHLGQIALKTGHAAEAVANFKEAVRLRPAIWAQDAFEDCLADAYLELGRVDEAISEYARVLQLNPNHALARYHLGRAYEQKGRQEAARAEYERFLEIWKDADPDIPEVIDAKSRSTQATLSPPAVTKGL